MAKGYWVTQYKKIHDADKMAAYGKLAGPAIEAAGGRIIVRATHAVPYDAGLNERTVVVEYESLEAALAAHESAPYQEALKALGDAVERDMRIVEGTD